MTDDGGVPDDDGRRLSDGGSVAAVAAAACLALGLLAAADGDTVVAVGPALLAGVYGSVLTARDALQDRPPTASDFGGLAAFCAFAAVAAAVDRSFLTAAGMALLALLNAGRWRGWRVEE